MFICHFVHIYSGILVFDFMASLQNWSVQLSIFSCGANSRLEQFAFFIGQKVAVKCSAIQCLLLVPLLAYKTKK